MGHVEIIDFFPIKWRCIVLTYTMLYLNCRWYQILFRDWLHQALFSILTKWLRTKKNRQYCELSLEDCDTLYIGSDVCLNTALYSKEELLESLHLVHCCFLNISAGSTPPTQCSQCQFEIYCIIRSLRKLIIVQKI